MKLDIATVKASATNPLLSSKSNKLIKVVLINYGKLKSHRDNNCYTNDLLITIFHRATDWTVVVAWWSALLAREWYVPGSNPAATNLFRRTCHSKKIALCKCTQKKENNPVKKFSLAVLYEVDLNKHSLRIKNLN